MELESIKQVYGMKRIRFNGAWGFFFPPIVILIPFESGIFNYTLEFLISVSIIIYQLSKKNIKLVADDLC